jgi:bacterioferritin
MARNQSTTRKSRTDAQQGRTLSQPRRQSPHGRLDESPDRVSRHELIELLNEDLAREYQAVIMYVNFSQVMKGPEYMSLAEEFAAEAQEELGHALILAKQIDYLGGKPTVDPEPVQTAEDPEEMLHIDLKSEEEAITRYRERIRQCEALSEYAIAENLRQLIKQEQEHLITVASALGKDVPDVSDIPMQGNGER